MKTMMWLVPALLAGGCVEEMQADEMLGQTEQTAGGQVIAHQVMNGGGLHASYGDPMGGWNLHAQENGAGQTRTASVSFNKYTLTLVCDPYFPMWCWQTYESIWGWAQIPPGDLTVSATGDSGRLLTTATFTFDTCNPWMGCTQEQRQYSFDITVTGNGFMHFTRAGTSTFTMGSPDMNGQIIQFRESGTYTTQGGDAAGTAFGEAFTNGFGHLQRSTGGQVIRDLIRTTP